MVAAAGKKESVSQSVSVEVFLGGRRLDGQMEEEAAEGEEEAAEGVEEAAGAVMCETRDFDIQ